MRYWWVNQNQTFKQEKNGGYIWSPKTRKDGGRNTFYDNMTRVSPGDVLFSFYKTQIPCIGIVTSHGYSQSKPEFGKSGAAWGTDGWMVNVEYKSILNVITPKGHMDILGPLLPHKYSPLQQNGRGNQGVYLAELPVLLGKKLLELIGNEVRPLLESTTEYIGNVVSDNDAEADRIEKLIKKNKNLSTTEIETIIKARKGQGTFRDNVLELHLKCPFTGISNPNLLKASHIKPWSKCESNEERLDPLNGLALSPTVDHLFDKGYISFTDEGTPRFSSKITKQEYQKLGLDTEDKSPLLSLNTKSHRTKYIAFHQKHIFRP